ncbi:von Willebrand factor type A domain protein [Rhodococcus erythropolis SK121]|nr:cutinase family protein [Rhodococcus qingshengii]EEN87701.1 von Willebrand factor type A domain protein [Rhodococcus erythropolis SK121]
MLYTRGQTVSRAIPLAPRTVGHAALAALAAFALTFGLFSTPTAQAEETTSSVLFVVDTSGSMAGSPLAQAKDALRAGIGALSSGQAAGLRSFAGDCGNGGQLLVPVATDNRDQLNNATNQLTAGGTTPTPDALRAAAGDLPSTGDRTIILISDGQSTCGDPCAVATELKTQLGIDFRVHAVGFNAPDVAESELSCIANATGGRYFTATNTTELSDAISAAVTTGSAEIRSDIDCDSPTFIGVRGSGESPQSLDLSYFRTHARTNKPYTEEGAVNLGMGESLAPMFGFLQRQQSVDYDFNIMSVSYPAIGVGASIGYYTNDYRESVDIGASNLGRIISALHTKCSNSARIVLAGYSQGANVVNRYLAQKQAVRAPELALVKSVVYFGDPNLRPGRAGERHEGTSYKALGVVAAGVTNGDADISDYLSSHPNVVSSFCLSGDIICNPPVDVVFGKGIHGSYGSPDTKITCPVNGEKNVVLYQCGAFRVMRDLGYTLPSVERTPTLLQRGQEILFSVGGWIANQPSLALFASTPQVIGNFTTDENGNATALVRVPDDADLGDHHLIVQQPGGRSVSVPVTVVDSASTSTPVFSFGPEDGVEDGLGSGSGSAAILFGS